MATRPEPDVEQLIDRLASEHEELRLRWLEMLWLLEEEVTARVEWEEKAARLQRQLDAVRPWSLMRLVAPLLLRLAEPLVRLRAKLRRRG